MTFFSYLFLFFLPPVRFLALSWFSFLLLLFTFFAFLSFVMSVLSAYRFLLRLSCRPFAFCHVTGVVVLFVCSLSPPFRFFSCLSCPLVFLSCFSSRRPFAFCHVCLVIFFFFFFFLFFFFVMFFFSPPFRFLSCLPCPLVFCHVCSRSSCCLSARLSRPSFRFLSCDVYRRSDSLLLSAFHV